MQQALQWLLVNNRYYRALGVTIDPNSLAQLPQDGNVSHLVSATETCSSVDNSYAANNQHRTDEDDDHLPQSFIPVAAPSMTEQEAVQQSVQQHHLPTSTLMWPSIGGVPLNEFTTEGYFTSCLPHPLPH